MTDEPDLRPAPAVRPAHSRPLLVLAVAAGGLLGTPVRYAVGRWLPTPAEGWPTATFLVNVAGAFLLGLLLEALARRGPDVGRRRALRLFAGTGFCGALTTYSTLAVEVDLLADADRWTTALGYGVASVVAGLAAAAAGIAVAGRTR
ncbi:Camphor resistance CrcB protein [Modestobacter italicus]|uniref:Fluoride-specific ion channel FluC n=1 Tax=Modestobacter italicus (strain DSM 44449 / CECT 9708 / BC 501) TaxID=2732864 RepID=I4EVT0_MODI5|nr:CrcB family protein [Modestobacter marinus]CCH87493.1 Camphor resistance CrcB protein [Modestobacter marinus]